MDSCLSKQLGSCLKDQEGDKTPCVLDSNVFLVFLLLFARCLPGDQQSKRNPYLDWPPISLTHYGVRRLSAA